MGAVTDVGKKKKPEALGKCVALHFFFENNLNF